MTAKAVGAASAGLRHLPVGTRVFVEGPYGAFTALHQAPAATLLIAGGVGITPIRALLEEVTGRAVVLYRVRQPRPTRCCWPSWRPGRGRGAAAAPADRAHRGGDPPFEPFDPHPSPPWCPTSRERDVFVCGPPAMTAAVLRSLRALGVPRGQVHAERFGLGLTNL